MMLALSYLHGRGRQVCPEAGRCGRPFSMDQWDMVYRVRRFADAWFRPPFLIGGRGLAKLGSLLAYGREVERSPVGASVPPPPALAATGFRAERVRFMSRGTHFDCTPYLDVFEP